MSKSPAQISQHIKQKAQQFGFAFCGISEAGFLEEEAPRLEAWLNSNQHGEMGYMARHGLKRARPAELVPGTLSVITARMNYLPQDTPEDWHYAEALFNLVKGE